MDLVFINDNSDFDLLIVKWLHYNRTEGCTTEAMDWAAYNGNMTGLEWLLLNRTEGCTTKQWIMRLVVDI